MTLYNACFMFQKDKTDNLMIKTITKINLSNTARPLTIIRNCLNLLGYQLTSKGSQRIAKKSLKVYQIVAPQDGREQVFQQV